jgi:L-seryl-tRNA(Ser) seleniumtransferase
MSEQDLDQRPALRSLPSVDEILRTDTAVRLRTHVGIEKTTSIARRVVSELRQSMQDQQAPVDSPPIPARAELLNTAERRLEEIVRSESLSKIRRVINATGVILHTNLGRAPLGNSTREALLREASGYCTLEYDSVSGKRGKRGGRVEQLLMELTGAGDALVVNNCAAAALLILTVLAREGETIVSRGELVEIGGDFRVPDVMANSGTKMIEVGTTNRTSLEDYRRAINPNTKLLMRVHPSNYRIVGFTTSPSLEQLVSLARESRLPLYEDAGSGVLSDLSAFGLGGEPVIKECISAGVDVVSFSGDKLLGSIQAGIVVGGGEIIGRLRKHPLYRALRPGKLSLAALEATLEAHRRGTALEEVPALQMLALGKDRLLERAKNLISSLTNTELRTDLLDGESAVGGGSGPDVHPPTTLIAVSHPQFSAEQIERHLRASDPPIIARIGLGKVLLDLRTVVEAEEPELARALNSLKK